MKSLLYILPAFLALTFISCLDSSEDDQFDQWRTQNIQWLIQQEELTNPDGSPYYEKITAPWDFQGEVLMRWHNDRELTKNNLSPLSNSTVDIKYHGRLITGEPFDSSYLRTNPKDSIYRSQLNKNINGWIIAVSQMHIGDSATIIVPYTQGYGTNGSGKIKPYSNLIFDVKLVDIPGYTTPVE